MHRHQLLGYVAKGWEHVHFAERRGGVYVNPLRDGGLGPPFAAVRGRFGPGATVGS